MQQQDIIKRQLAEKVTDFIKPAIPYLIIDLKRRLKRLTKSSGLISGRLRQNCGKNRVPKIVPNWK
jgi:hypothetical protein